MAYIYRYHLKNRFARDRLNLSVYNKDKEITNLITEVIGRNNIKSISIYREYLEIRIHLPVRIDTMYPEIFSQIKELIRNNPRVIYNGEKLGFEKIYLDYYLFIDTENFDLDKEAELILKEDFEIIINSENEETKKERLRKSDILKISNLDINILDYPQKINNCTVLECKGIMRTRKSNNSNPVYSYLDPDIQYERNNLIKEVLGESYEEYNEDTFISASGIDYQIADTFAIKEIKISDIISEDRDKFSLDIPTIDTNKIKEDYSNLQIKDFIVFNVGQGLSTVVVGEKNSKTVNIFFDFGSNRVQDIKDLDTYIENTELIFLSHKDTDHWKLINQYKEANDKTWIVPANQIKDFSLGLTMRLANVTNIFSLDKSISIANNQIEVYSKLSAKHKHRSGISMFLEIQKDQKNIRILNPGDQKYADILDDTGTQVTFSDIDILVASHHGGKYHVDDKRSGYDCFTYSTCNICGLDQDKPYCWQYDCFMNIIPSPKDTKSVVVFSSGNNNKYSHPSRTLDYIRINAWNNKWSLKDKGEHFMLSKWI